MLSPSEEGECGQYSRTSKGLTELFNIASCSWTDWRQVSPRCGPRALSYSRSVSRGTGVLREDLHEAAAGSWWTPGRGGAAAGGGSAMVKVLARAFRWRKLPDDGVHGTIEDLSAAKRLPASYVSAILRLTLLAPRLWRRSSTGGNGRSCRSMICWMGSRWSGAGSLTGPSEQKSGMQLDRCVRPMGAKGGKRTFAATQPDRHKARKADLPGG